jgi:hypothetical protein
MLSVVVEGGFEEKQFGGYALRAPLRPAAARNPPVRKSGYGWGTWLLVLGLSEPIPDFVGTHDRAEAKAFLNFSSSEIWS